jgi:heptosyltransferase-3
MTSAALELPERPSILVVTLRRLGDVLLTTPLIHALRERWPRAAIDALVFQGTEGMLAGNPDLNGVRTLPSRPSALGFLGLLTRLWGRYDLAVCTQTGDRPVFLGFAAGRRRLGFVGRQETGHWWKRQLLHHRVPVEHENHRVVELMRLAEALGVSAPPRIVCPRGGSALDTPSIPYAVVHASPMFRYRQWTDEGWRALVRGLSERGLPVVATGAPHETERAYLDRVFAPVEGLVRRIDGQADWPQLAALLGAAAVYVGPDTSMTHLAAGAGCPTVAIYGPASPRRIGPWPADGLAQPWDHAGTVQRRGNVWVVQHPLPCLPCEKVGCEGHVESFSRCLDELPARQVLAAVDAALVSRFRSSLTPAAPPDANFGIKGTLAGI